MNTWHNICITDKTGVEYFKCTASPMSTASELRNLKRHLDAAKANPKAYAMLDIATAVIMLDGLPYGEVVSELDVEKRFGPQEKEQFLHNLINWVSFQEAWVQEAISPEVRETLIRTAAAPTALAESSPDLPQLDSSP